MTQHPRQESNLRLDVRSVVSCPLDHEDKYRLVSHSLPIRDWIPGLSLVRCVDKSKGIRAPVARQHGRSVNPFSCLSIAGELFAEEIAPAPGYDPSYRG